jgi:hypothetical protein
VNLLLAVLTTLRLTRLVTTDWVGYWWFRAPAQRWAGRHEVAEIRRRVAAEEDRVNGDHTVLPENHAYMNRAGERIGLFEFVTQDYDEKEPWSWQAKLVKGLECPFCIGFWIGVAVLLSLAIARAVPPLLPVWRFFAGTFALNAVVGHVSARIDG